MEPQPKLDLVVKAASCSESGDMGLIEMDSSRVVKLSATRDPFAILRGTEPFS